ncbi:hypothetical protein [Adlercreutzia sp. ZJ138]|uniref:type IV toxin-antitoxin system AbiEi family antitoxin domain-containing protein n=1 Tax=Adlercreutzia sp. ZJ138 TaxID=2709405 RepID=UPI0013E9B4EA|nr:hypothetical protein [Adlercreutzia sp. ZJ138]
MLKTTKMLQEELSSYGAPKNKIARMVRDGELTRIVKGLYETDASTPPEYLAASIYGPSYVSFEYALTRHSMIPEAARVVTSATFEKGKAKCYNTPFGTFTFRDVPSSAFPWGIDTVVEGRYAYRIATPEKALCDTLWLCPPVANYRELETLLFDDLRLEPSMVHSLDTQGIAYLAKQYRSTTICKLAKYLKRKTRHELHP